MMKKAGDLKEGIQQIGDVVDIVLIGKMVSSRKIHQPRVKEKRNEKGMTLMGSMKGVHHCLREQKRGVAT